MYKMPYKPKKSCKYPRCPNLIRVDQAYCNTHKGLNRRSSTTKQGYNYRWQKESKKFLAENPYCFYCMQKGLTVLASIVDHIIPHRGDMELFWNKANWQSLCKRHHNIKSAKGK